MKKFNVRVVFENNTEELRIIEAKSSSEAKKICEQIYIENKEIIERCASKNIYTTRIIKECSIYGINWRDELLGCLDLTELEDNV